MMKQRWIGLGFGITVFLIAFGLALAQQLFQASREVPADLEVFETQVLPGAQLVLQFQDGSPVDFLSFRTTSVQPPQGEKLVARATSIFATNETDPPIALTLIDPCRPAIDSNTGEKIGHVQADLFGGVWWDAERGQWNTDEAWWAGNTCDLPRPREWRLGPGDTYLLRLWLELDTEFEQGPFESTLDSVVVGGVGGEVLAPEPIQPPGGMVGWWPADGHANDIVGGNHGTLSGDASFDAGMVQQGFSLDGTGDFVLVPDSPELNITGDVTVDLWAKRTVLGRNSLLVDKGANIIGPADQPDAYAMWFSQNDYLVAGFAREDGSLVFLVGPLITDRRFHHYAYVRSGNTHTLLMDGSVVASDSFTGVPGDTSGLPLAIGAVRRDPNPPGFSSHFGGVIDEVEIFNRALNSEEIRAIYEAGSAGKIKPEPIPPPDGIVSWWPGDGNANDIVGGNHGTLQGGATFATGMVGQAFSLDGVDDTVETPSRNWGFSTNATVMAWIKITDTAGTVLSLGHGYLQDELLFHVFRDGKIAIFNHKSANKYTGRASDTNVNTGQWVHVAGSLDGGGSASNLRIFVNGIEEAGEVITSGSPTDIVDTTPRRVIIGWRTSRDVAIEAFQGEIDEVGLFNRVLSPAEIRAIYDAGSLGMIKPPPPPPPEPIPPPAGIVGWWPGDGNANDVVGGVDGTPQSGATFAPGLVGQAFSLDGGYDFVSLPDDAFDALFAGGEISIEAWMKTGGVASQSSDSRSGIAAAWDFTAVMFESSWWLYFDFAEIGVITAVWDGVWPNRLSSATFISDNEWHHVASTYSGGTARIYVDGVLRASEPRNLGNGVTNRFSGGAFNNYPGLLDEITLYSRALTAAEIRAIYVAGSAGKIQPLIVTKTEDSDDGVCDADCSLREAIAAAGSGDTIAIPAGTYTLTLGSQLTIDKSLTLGGAGSEDTVIQSATEPGVAFQRVFVIESGGTVTISGLTIRHGRVTGFGGGIHNSGTLTLTNSAVSDNIARDPFGGNGGGIFNRSATLALTNSTVSGNTATLQGGGIFSNGTLTITNSTISNNTAGSGGGINNDDGGVLTLANSVVIGNTSPFGGGLFNAGTGTLDVSNSTVSNNTSSAWGGGILNIGTLTLNDSTVSGNTANINDGVGGGILNRGTGTITRSTISGNAADEGGGIYNDGSTLTMTNSTVSGNNAGRGGGIYSYSTLTITNSSVRGNSATADGGGIYSSGALTVTNGTMSHNSASRGGGIFNSSSDLVLTLNNSTVSNNSASSDGGGIYSASGILTLTSSTVTNNSASQGGGIDTANGSPGNGEMANTIVAGNTATIGADCVAGSFFASLGYNLIGRQFGCGLNPATGDLPNTDPLLGPLQDNGGPTFTHALLPGSPAIDHIPAENCDVATDQRGVARPQGAACDIGAYEVGPIPPPAGMVAWWPGDGNADDIVGNNDGILQGGATFAPGMVGQAFSFDGSDDYVTFGTTVGNFGNSDFTIDFWIKTSSTRQEGILGKRRVCTHGSFFDIRLGVGAQGKLNIDLDNDSQGSYYNNIVTTKTVNDTNFHHVAVVRQGTAASVYIDGVLDVAGTTPGVTTIVNSSHLIAGKSTCTGIDGTDFFTGLLDELEIFNRALTAEEIRAIYEAGSAGKIKPPPPEPIPPPAGMVSWWPGDGNANDIVDGNHGALQGDATFAPGMVGQAFSFDGTGDFVLVPDSADLNITSDVTVDLWAKRTVFDSSQEMVGKAGSFEQGGIAAYEMWFRSDNAVLAGALSCIEGHPATVPVSKSSPTSRCL